MKISSNLLMSLLGILLLGLITSFAVKLIWFQEDTRTELTIELLAPISGDNVVFNQAIQQGIELYLDKFNQRGQLRDYKIKLRHSDHQTFDSTQHDNSIGIVNGYWQHKDIIASLAVAKNNKIPAITLAATDLSLFQDAEWNYRANYSVMNQAKFIANYVRNIQGRKLITIIHDDSDYGTTLTQGFTGVYARFGTSINLTRAITSSQPNAVSMVVNEIKDRKDLGTLFIAGSLNSSVQLVKQLRDAGVKNPIVGTDVMATHAFKQKLQALIDIDQQHELAFYTNKILVSSPLLYDTAGEQTQLFRNIYLKKYHAAPDWISAYAYDAAAVLVQSYVKSHADQSINANQYLSQFKQQSNALTGASGAFEFSLNKKTVQIGSYNGASIVASLTQLQAIKAGSVSNYFEKLKQGKMLYVNDRFMYKSNVVYSGIEVNEITEVNLDDYSAVFNFSIWFRYSGKFDPADIVFPDALDPIKLEKPAILTQDKTLTFKLYQVSGKFSLDALKTKRSYGSHVLSISFQHKTLNSNNLIYVVDILGMGFESGKTLQETIKEDRVINPGLGWKVEKAWIAQDIIKVSSLGKPEYIGFGSVNPEFSRINMGIIINEDKLNAHDIFPSEYFLYIGIFGLIGSLFAIVLGFKSKGSIAEVSAWFLKLMFWPLTLLAVGNLILDTAINMNLSTYHIDNLVMVYKILWWLVPARLLALALELFIWTPLEKRTQRMIPTVVRLCGSFVIYLIACLGIIAFVFNQHLTSLLATGGLFAMIIGLAVQSNISNIFSGIVVNIERPFSVGDWIKIGNMEEAKIIDMTWRTLRIRTMSGKVISVPNGKASEAIIINYSVENIRIDMPVQVSPEYNPNEMIKIFNEILLSMEGMTDAGQPSVLYAGIVTVYSDWVSEYIVRFWVNDYSQAMPQSSKVWQAIWIEFKQRDLSLKGGEGGMDNEHHGEATPYRDAE